MHFAHVKIYVFDTAHDSVSFPFSSVCCRPVGLQSIVWSTLHPGACSEALLRPAAALARLPQTFVGTVLSSLLLPDSWPIVPAPRLRHRRGQSWGGQQLLKSVPLPASDRPRKAPPLGLLLAVGFHGRPVSGWRNSLLSLVRVFSNSWILSSDFSASIKRVIRLRFSSLSPSWYGELHYWVCNFILVVSGFGLMAMLVL